MTSPITSSVTPERRSARRLWMITGIASLVWFGVYLADQEPESGFQERSNTRHLPDFSHWQSITLTRPSTHKVTLTRTSRRNAAQSDHVWLVSLPHEPQRPVDPLLIRRLSALTTLDELEERVMQGETASRALGLTEVALAIEVTLSSKYQASTPRTTLRFRLGAEHQRHSTWIQRLDAQGAASGPAVRVNGRLRRALDHDPHRWPDRRVAHTEPQRLEAIICYLGGYQHVAPGHFPSSTDQTHHSETSDQTKSGSASVISSWRHHDTRHRTWMIHRVKDQWRARKLTRNGVTRPRDTPARGSALLDQSVVHGLAYTLGSLRFERFINVRELPKTWRPTYTFEWVDHQGIQGRLSLGRVTLKGAQHPIWIGESQKGIGVIPSHLTQLLTPRLSQLLKRAPFPLDVATLTEVSYLAPPTPIVLSETMEASRSWSMEKRSTGWWLTTPPGGPVAERALTSWLDQARRNSAAASLIEDKIRAAQPDAQTSAPQAELLMTTVDEDFCESLGQTTPCKFVLTHTIPPDGHTTFTWMRLGDGVRLSLSRGHHRALISGPQR